MAYRIIVVAVRNTTRDELRTRNPDIGSTKMEEANGWCWFSTSLRNDTLHQMVQRHHELRGPVLLASTEDGSRWYLRLLKHGKPPFLTMHNFANLEEVIEDITGSDDDDLYEYDADDFDDEDGSLMKFGSLPIPKSNVLPVEFRDPFFHPYLDDWEEDDWREDDDEESTLDLLCDTYMESGVPLSESIVNALSDVPDDKVWEQFFLCHAQEICHALQLYGVPHQKEQICEVLTGKSVTQVELDGDLGNLPRFLSALGLGEHFDKMLEDAEKEAREWNEQEPENYAEEVLNAMPELQPIPLSEPIVLPIKEAPLLFRAGFYTNIDTRGAFTAILPQEAELTPGTHIPSYISVHESENGLQVGGSDEKVFRLAKAVKKMGRVLAGLPDGTSLTLHLHSEMAQSQLFCGTIRGSQWHIESTSPEFSRDVLKEAIGFFREVLSENPIRARDEMEGIKILAAATESSLPEDTLPELDGLNFIVKQRERDDLAELIFRLRFGHVWDCSAAIAEERETFEILHSVFNADEDTEHLPATEKVIFDGAASKFYEADLTTADKMMSHEINNLAEVIKQYERLGFSHLGEFVCEKIGSVVISAYANIAEKVYGVHYISDDGMTWHEYYTHFEDGTSLTTTCGIGEGSIARLRILQHSSEEKCRVKLFEEHKKGLAILAGHGVHRPILDPSLEGIASSMDKFILKRTP